MNSIQDLWKKRFGTSSAPKNLVDNPVLRAQFNHHSVRQYQKRDIPDGMLEVGLGAASSSATSINYQIWSAIVVKDQKKRDRLATLAGNQKHISEAPVFIVWVADIKRHRDMAEMYNLNSEVADYFETFLTASVDVGIAAQNANLAFESMGLGTLFVGGIRNHLEEVSELLNLPKSTVAIVGMCVGFKADDAHGGIKPRLPHEVTVKHDEYKAITAEQLKKYDQVASEYQVSQGLPPRNWSSVIATRFADVKNLGSREFIRKTLNNLGFTLK